MTKSSSQIVLMKSPEKTDGTGSEKAKKAKSTAIVNALLIGFLIGVLVFGFVKNGFGFFALIPLYFIYKLVNKPESEDPE